MVRKISASRSLRALAAGLLLPAGLAGCAEGGGGGPVRPAALALARAAAPAQAAASPWEGRYLGPVQPLAAGCGILSQGILTVLRGTDPPVFALDPMGEALDPRASSQAILGTIAPDGSLRGQRRGEAPGQAAGQARFEGQARLAEGRREIVGTLSEGICRWRMTLRQV